MKKKYTRKQICEAISYWKKQLNESANGGDHTCPYCGAKFDILAVVDDEDNNFASNGPYMIEYVKDRHSTVDVENVINKINAKCGVCSPDTLRDLVDDLVQHGYIQDTSEYGGDNWTLLYI